MASKVRYGPQKVAHPAVFSRHVLHACGELLTAEHRRILDPFAGVGKVHDLAELLVWDPEIVGVELEPEWAVCHPNTQVGNALELVDLFGADSFDAVLTSPAYGNRLADHHDAQDGSYRRSYRHDLGRPLDSENSGRMQWGPNYRSFHLAVWEQVAEVVRDGGRLVLSISDHIRAGRRRYVAAWHVETLRTVGFRLADVNRVSTRRFGYGANRDKRVGAEMVLAFDLTKGG